MDLDAQIAEHRGLYSDDLTSISRLVARSPPVTRNARLGTQESEPSAVYGMNLSARMIRYLGHPEGYGSAFPWSRALWKLRNDCRREHRRHRGPRYWDGSLCAQLVRYIVIREFSVLNAARILRYDRPEPTLREAFRIIERNMEQAAERAAREDRVPNLSQRLHTPLPGLHVQECPTCQGVYSEGVI